VKSGLEEELRWRSEKGKTFKTTCRKKGTQREGSNRKRGSTICSLLEEKAGG